MYTYEHIYIYTIHGLPGHDRRFHGIFMFWFRIVSNNNYGETILLFWWPTAIHSPHIAFLAEVKGKATSSHRQTPKIHPNRLTWNLRIHPWKRKIIFQIINFTFHVLILGYIRGVLLSVLNVSLVVSSTSTSFCTTFHHDVHHIHNHLQPSKDTRLEIGQEAFDLC